MFSTVIGLPYAEESMTMRYAVSVTLLWDRRKPRSDSKIFLSLAYRQILLTVLA